MEKYILGISENEETIKQFNDMHNKVINENEYQYYENIDIISYINENNNME